MSPGRAGAVHPEGDDPVDVPPVHGAQRHQRTRPRPVDHGVQGIAGQSGDGIDTDVVHTASSCSSILLASSDSSLSTPSPLLWSLCRSDPGRALSPPRTVSRSHRPPAPPEPSDGYRQYRTVGPGSEAEARASTAGRAPTRPEPALRAVDRWRAAVHQQPRGGLRVPRGR